MNFAIAWIVFYCALQSLANPLNELLGVEYAASAVFGLLQSIVLFMFLRRNYLLKRYGLRKSPLPAGRFLYYIPLLILVSRNLWNGAALNLKLAGTVSYIVCMLCVGFLEEVIFRGFLFRAMAKDNVRTAIVVSSITFGLGHLINLINGSGAGLADNLFQVSGAIVIGFLFVILYDRGGSLLPCIITHAAVNVSSAFVNEMGMTLEKRLVFHIVIMAINIAYALFLTKTLPRICDADGVDAEMAASRAKRRP